MTQPLKEDDPNLDGAPLSIAVVLSRFNRDIGDGLLSACLAELQRLGVAPARTRVYAVPGALELPLVLQRLRLAGEEDALIALGAVVRGETYHFEIVSNESARGITEVQLRTGIPIANGVLTTEDESQAEARMADKGRDCAQAAVEMAHLIRRLTP